MFVIYLLISFSTIASYIGPDDYIDTSQENYLSNILILLIIRVCWQSRKITLIK